MTTYKFDDDSTEGYTQDQLDGFNAELDAAITAHPDADVHDIFTALSDEVSKR